MIIMGIDPGTATTGWGLIEVSRKPPTFVATGIISTPKTATESARLAMIYKDMVTLLKKYKPDIVAVERIFFNTNVTTALTVGQARGVVLLSIEEYKVPVFSYTPLQVKMALTGYGRADKKQVQKMIQTILKLDQIPKPDDAADALAVALTHSFTKKFG
jgi:crossover junction endodeoxyribonuclease RuvC